MNEFQPMVKKWTVTLTKGGEPGKKLNETSHHCIFFFLNKINFPSFPVRCTKMTR